MTDQLSDDAAGSDVVTGLGFAPEHDKPLQYVAEAVNYTSWILDRAGAYLGERVLDFGAGLGTFTAELVRAGREVVAVEPHHEYAELLRARFVDEPAVEILERDASGLDPVALGPFDAIVCFNVLEHIPDDDAVLRLFHELLRPGGFLLLLVPAHPSLHGSIDRNVGHQRRYQVGPLRAQLERHRLSVHEIRYVNPLGGLGWYVSSRLLRRPALSQAPMRLFNRLIPVVRVLDRLRLPFGLSVWAVARRPEQRDEMQ